MGKDLGVNQALKYCKVWFYMASPLG